MLFKTIATGQLFPGLYTVNCRYVNFYIYTDKDFIFCFDAGTGQRRIKKELKKINISPEQVTHVFLTHSDKDHVDGLKLFTNARVYMSKPEIALTEGKIKRSPFARNVIKNFKCRTLNDGETITIGTTKIQAISTPGHTPGSMSYLLNDHILFIGDCFHIEKNTATTGKNFLNMDMERQQESIKKLAQLKDIKIVCTGHTGTSEYFDSIMEKWQFKQ
ncbi:MBL fold metallo-hydrolase [candidate division KSB1 bacterium]|nr:MBL fold metallo-hydrolase [candidate division KSB1 bacterium]